MVLLHELLKRDPRFSVDAYMLLNDGLQYAYKLTGRKDQITARELLEGIRRLMAERYGPLAKSVLNSWGIFSTDDIGQIVLNLVEAGLLPQSPNHRPEKFHAVYDFEQTFVRDYEITGSTLR